MQDAVSTPSRVSHGRTASFSRLATRVRFEAPSIADCAVALLSSALVIFSFPDFNLWPLAWFGLVPLFLIVARKTLPWRCFLLGWLFGTIFFYGSCYWLTYSMIHFGGIQPWLAFPLLLPGAVLLGIFPGVVTLVLARLIRNWTTSALFLAPLLWSALEWGRLETTGQLWNAIGYSQAYHPLLIQTARWGGVYLVGFFIVFVNAAIAFVILKRSTRALLISATLITLTVVLVLLANRTSPSGQRGLKNEAEAIVVAVQPNVPMEVVKSDEDMRKL